MGDVTRVGVNSSVINNILTVTISNLEMNIQYAFSIAAVTAAGRGPYTAYVNQTTAQDVPTDIPVINSLAAVANTLPSILSAVWTEPTPTTHHGPIVLYQDQYRRATTTLSDGTVLNTASLPVNANAATTTFYSYNITTNGSATSSATLPPLNGPSFLIFPSVDYEVQIAAINVAGQSPFSTLTVTRTAEAAPDGPPLSVVARNSSSTSILVTFDTPAAGLRNGIVTMFTVYFGKVPGQPNAAATPVPCSNPLVAGDLCPINVNRTLIYM